MLSCIGRGTCSIAQQSELASAMCREGVASEFVQAFASLGHGGIWTSNVERDLHRWLRRALNIKLETFPLPMRLLPKTGRNVRWVHVPILLPHELFACLSDAG
eukprot:2224489-Alexandrium_andersonii.AAC.1